MKKITSLFVILIMLFTMGMTVSADDTSVPVVGSETLRIELEDSKYNAYAGCKESDGTASASFYIIAGQLSESSCSKPVNDITLKVEKTGYYHIEYLMSYTNNTASYSKISMSLTNTPESGEAKTINLFDNTKKAVAASGYSRASGNGYPMHIYSKGVKLEKGDLTIVVTVDKVSGTSYRRFALDYIEFKPVTANETGSTVVEFDDYIDNAYVGTIEYDTTASGSRYSKAGGYANDPSITTEVEFKKSGFYDVSTIMGSAQSSACSSVDVTVTDSSGNELVKFNNKTDTGLNLSGYTANTNTNTKAQRYSKKLIEIPQGIVTVKATVSKNSSGKYMYLIDCLEFSPSNGVSLSDETVYEFEQYTGYSGFVVSNVGGSGGAFLRAGGSDQNPDMLIDVVVEESGYYNIDSVINWKAGMGSVSKTTVYVVNGNEETKLFDNTSPGWTTAGYTFNVGSTPVSVDRYTKRGVYLPQGKVTIKVDVEKASDNYYRFCMDYIKFSKADYIIDGEYDITASVDTNTQKTMDAVVTVKSNTGSTERVMTVIALYDSQGNLMAADSQIKDVSASGEQFDVSASVTGEDAVKRISLVRVFVWDAKNLTPLR